MEVLPKSEGFMPFFGGFMSWRVLYVEESEMLSLYLDNVKVKRGTVELSFPLNDIAIIVIDNFRLSITINLLNACSLRNIPVVMCGDNHHPLNIVLPLNGHYNSSKIFLEQLEWKKELKNIFWKIYVKQKIKNQLFVLQYLKPEANEAIEILKTYIEEVQEYDSTNREGLSAKVYFRALFGTNFSRQNDDTINACLNYGYSILRALISKTIVAKGLNQQLGIFHKGPTNFFNLSDDIIEIFRPIIDMYVYKKFINEKIFLREHRMQILEILNMKICVDNQKITLNHAIERTIDGVIKFFKNGQADTIIKFDPILYDL